MSFATTHSAVCVLSDKFDGILQFPNMDFNMFRWHFHILFSFFNLFSISKKHLNYMSIFFFRLKIIWCTNWDPTDFSMFLNTMDQEKFGAVFYVTILIELWILYRFAKCLQDTLNFNCQVENLISSHNTLFRFFKNCFESVKYCLKICRQ